MKRDKMPPVSKNPYTSPIVGSILAFVAVIFVVIFLAAYVAGAIKSHPNLSEAAVIKNTTPPGKLYFRE